MNMHTKAALSLFCLAGFSCAQAADFDDYARVVRVTPQIERFNQPRQECHDEYVPSNRQHSHNSQPTQSSQQRSNTGAILGGIAGGILGNQVGGGNGRTAATAVGAITGAIIGDRVDNDQSGNRDDSRNGYRNGSRHAEQVVRECRTVDSWQTRTNGYSVVYEYRGQTYTSMMPYDPGERLKLRVSIAPQI